MGFHARIITCGWGLAFNVNLVAEVGCVELSYPFVELSFVMSLCFL